MGGSIPPLALVEASDHVKTQPAAVGPYGYPTTVITN
jgi:hypothetical protein